MLVGCLTGTTSLKFANITNLPTDAILKTKGQHENQESGIRNPEQKTGLRIQRNPQDSSIRLYKNCLKILSTQMFYFSIRGTREKI